MIAASVKPDIAFPGRGGSVVKHLLREPEGSNSGRAIPNPLKMVPAATLLNAQH